jgi:hypothetical protein
VLVAARRFESSPVNQKTNPSFDAQTRIER